MEMLLDKEEFIYSIILEYLNHNRPFRTKEIIPYISSRCAKISMNINEVGIMEILTSLVRKKVLVEGSVLTKNELLQNEKRKQIFTIVKNRPGIIFNQIVKESNYSNYIVYWHLKILIKFNCIKKAIIGKHQIFFSSTEVLETAELAHFISKKKSQQIIEYLRNNDIGVSKTQISTNLNMHINTATKYLKQLEILRVLTRESLSNQYLYFLHEDYF